MDNNFKSIQCIAEKYHFSHKRVKEWASLRMFKILRQENNPVLICEPEFQKFIDLNTVYENQLSYLKQLIEEKKEEINNVIETYDDHLFLARTHRKLSPLTPFITQELSCLIRNTKHRDIFVEVATGKKIKQIAQEKGITYDRVCQSYEYGISCILKKRTELYNIRKTISDSQIKIRELELKNRNQQLLINKLTKMLEEKICSEQSLAKDVPKLTEEELNFLITPCYTALDLNTRSYNILNSEGINTIADLVRYINQYGLPQLLKIRCCGIASYRIIEEELKAKGIIDSEGKNVYEKYLSVI